MTAHAARKRGCIVALVLGLLYPPYLLAVVMLATEAVFSVCLYLECKKAASAE